jgi:hypothetical protein
MAEYTGELLDAPPKPVRAAAPPPAVAPAAVATPVATPAIADSTGFDEEFEKNRKRMEGKFEQKKTEQVQAAPLIQEDSWLSPPALVGMGGAAGAALMYGGSKAAPMVKRWLSSGQGAPQGFVPSNVDVDPSFGKFFGDGTAPAAAAPTPATPAAAPSRNLTLEEAQARLAGVAPTPNRNVTAGITPARTLVVPEAVAPAMVEAPKPIAPSAAPNSAATQAVTETIQQLGQAETPVVAMPSRPVTPTPAAALPVAPPTGELKTGSGLTAYPGQGKPKERFPKEFKTVADIPAGYAFVPGMGPGTNVIRNDFGQAGYNALVAQQGGPFGSDAETRAFIKQFNEERIGPPATRELRKKLELPMPENTTGVPMRKAVVGGIAGAVLAIPDLANAAQNRNVGQAAEVGAGFLPPFLQALTYAKGAGEGEAAELDRQRRMQEYALRAGRGVAQGYDPRQLIGVAPPTR